MSPLPPLLLEGDCLDELKRIPDESIDAIVTDPPYGLDFMGKAWDSPAKMLGQMSTGNEQRGAYAYGGTHSRGYADNDNAAFQRWCEAWATECLRILKPGGHMLAFGGTRTWHRLAAGIEDAGFEIRDSIAWLYGSGFPKSLDVSKAIDKAAGVEFSARPASGVGFMRADGRGGYNVTRNQLTREGESTDAAREWDGWGTALKPAFEPIVVARKPLGEKTVAANVLAHGTGALNIDATRIGDEVRSTTRSTGVSISGNSSMAGNNYAREPGPDVTGRWPANVVLDESQAAALDAQTVAANGASRFFYVAKAPKSERPIVDGVAHATVKPLMLMRWLIRLVTPPGGVIVDPFAGSGATLEAAYLEGFESIGVEMTPDYWPLIQARIARVVAPDA